MHEKAKYYIDKLKLQKHPEGGYFNEIYRADEIFTASVLPKRYNGDRVFSTSIYFLLDGKDVSGFHKLQSDEIWHFYDGYPVRVSIITPQRTLEERMLGNNLDNNENIQTVINKRSWFGAELIDKSSFSLIGCTVSPGFDFQDFEMGKRNQLLDEYPEFSSTILRLTKP